MVVRTRAAGRTGIRVKVQCLNASAGQFEGNVAELSDQVQVLVGAKGSLQRRCLEWETPGGSLQEQEQQESFIWGACVGHGCKESFAPPCLLLW